MAVEGKGLIARSRSWRDTPQRPKSDKFCRFHNDYGHSTEECRHLKNEIERLIHNGYLQEYVCWEKARGTGPYQKKDGDKTSSPERSSREGAKETSGGKGENDDIPRKGVIRMIAGGPSGGDSHQVQKSQVREAHQISIKEVLNVETMEDAPLIQFERAEKSGPQTMHNDALVITAILANYEVGRIFIDSESSVDILFGEAYDQMQLGDVSLEKTHAYTFQAVISTYHMKKIKFPTPGGIGEVRGDPLQSRRCYVDAVRRGEKRGGDDTQHMAPPRDPDKTTRIGSHLGEEAKKEITLCLQRNADIFAWTPQDLEGIDPQVITHHLNIDPNCKPVKQKKRHFGPEKDKIIQAEVKQLMTAGHIENTISLSNVIEVFPVYFGRVKQGENGIESSMLQFFYPLPGSTRGFHIRMRTT
ncbi:UNVERIFIED_CONTAM: hypothetical protein Slati_1787500 [Sesamum latifolium]|uniref:Reverse transcriptase domain-containing protein n=1 Tax=Sesamum latifolium TaxID=2727402 RepID=A0AAW2X0H0_9LAMI